MADPSPVAGTFLMDQTVRDYFRLDGSTISGCTATATSTSSGAVRRRMGATRSDRVEAHQAMYATTRVRGGCTGERGRWLSRMRVCVRVRHAVPASTAP